MARQLHGFPPVLFSYSPIDIGRIPICPRTCCGPRHCQRVSEPMRRALIFGALWQHHGLYDYFFVQSCNKQGIIESPLCNIPVIRTRSVEIVQSRRKHNSRISKKILSFEKFSIKESRNFKNSVFLIYSSM